jgi:glycosyltransferase involved in cell wall biosynthesis
MEFKSTISIIIPFYNEKAGIEILLQKINEYYSQREFEFDVIFVDDGSIDETSTIIKNDSSINYPCKLITLSNNFGSHAAIRAGFIYATGDYVTCLPTDLQISFDTVEKLNIAVNEGYDIVYGVRDNVEINYIEKIFSRTYSFLMRKFVNKNFPYKGLETVLISAKVQKVLNQNVEENSNFVLQLLLMGFKNKFIVIDKVKRKQGKSKWTFQKKVKLMIDSFVAFSYTPIRFVTIMGILFSLLGFLWTGYIILRTFLYHDLSSGWPALVSILMIGFGVTNISLGIIAEYLWRTLDASRKRPVFIIDDITKIKDGKTK